MQVGYKGLQGIQPNGRFLFGGLDSAGGTKAIKSVVQHSMSPSPKLSKCKVLYEYSQTENGTAKSPKMPHQAM